MANYNVYEKRGDGEESYIGSVEADSLEAARKIAGQKYGAPIEVREA